jgi:hypothetical protein
VYVAYGVLSHVSSDVWQKWIKCIIDNHAVLINGLKYEKQLLFSFIAEDVNTRRSSMVGYAKFAIQKVSNIC